MGKSGHQRSVAKPLSQSSTSISRRPQIAKGKAASSNPKSNRFRLAARNIRLANLAPMVAVDEHQGADGGEGAEDLIRHLSIMNPPGAEMAGSSRNSIVSIQESVLTRATEKELGTTSTAEFRSHVATVLKMILAEHDQIVGGMIPSNLDHYSALLEVLKCNIDVNKPEVVAAVAYLLHLCAKKLPKKELTPLVDESCEAITPLMRELTGNSGSSAAGAALKFLVSLLGCLLGARREEDETQELQTQREEVYVQLVELALDDARLAVRATARKTLRTLLTDPLKCGDAGWHPASAVVAAHLLPRIRSSPSGANEKWTRLFCLLEGIMHRMSGGDFRQLVEALLSFCASSRDVAGVCAALKCLCEVLSHQPQELSLHPDANVELIHALQSLPPTTDHSVLAYWIRTLVEAHVCLASDVVRSADSLEDTTKLLGRLFAKLAGGKEMGECLLTASQRLIQCCLRPSGWSSTGYAARDFLRHLDDAFSARNHLPGWEWVLRTMCSLLEECQEQTRGEEVKKVLQTMATLRDRSEEEGEESGRRRRELDQLFATAIRHLGLEYVLGVVSLLEDLDPDVPVMSTEFKRSWLLPIAAQSVRHCSLAYFNRYLLPLATRLHSRFSQSQTVTAGRNAALQTKLYATVEAQLWSLLPKIVATEPVDFTPSFSPLCPVLGAALNERADLRLTLLATIRAALHHVVSSDERGEEDCAVMERYAKNFLPILFSLYSGQQVESTSGCNTLTRVNDKSVRLATLETIRLYVPRVPQPLLATYINLAVEKTSDQQLAIDRRSAIMDILVALVKGVSSAELLETSIMPSVKRWLLDGSSASSTARRNSPLQKKAYRLLSEIYQRANEPSLQSFFASNSPFIDAIIASGVEGVAPNARPWRVALYRNLITAHSAGRDESAIAIGYGQLKSICACILDEVTECLDRENNNKACRTQAAKCICEMCAALVAGAEENGELAYIALDPVVSQLVVRRPNTYNPSNNSTNAKTERKHLRTARSRLIALNIVTQKHLRQMNASLLSRLLAYAVESMAHPEPSIRMLAIRLLRVASTKMQNFSLIQYKDMLLTAALKQPIDKDTPVKVRKANALLFEAFLEKFGLESMLSLAEHNPLLVKQLKNLEKGIRRRERKNQAATAGRSGEQTGDDRREEEEGGGDESLVSGYHSSAQLTHGARTAHVDSIFELLEDSDNNDDDEEHREANHRSVSVILGEGVGEDPVDLLDRDAMLGRVSRAPAQSNPFCAKRQTPHKDNTQECFPVDSQNGKLVIVELERQERKLEKKRRRGNQGGEDGSDDDDGDNEEVEEGAQASKTNKKRRRRHADVLDEEE